MHTRIWGQRYIWRVLCGRQRCKRSALPMFTRNSQRVVGIADARKTEPTPTRRKSGQTAPATDAARSNAVAGILARDSGGAPRQPWALRSAGRQHILTNWASRAGPPRRLHEKICRASRAHSSACSMLSGISRKRRSVPTCAPFDRQIQD